MILRRNKISDETINKKSYYEDIPQLSNTKLSIFVNI